MNYYKKYLKYKKKYFLLLRGGAQTPTLRDLIDHTLPGQIDKLIDDIETLEVKASKLNIAETNSNESNSGILTAVEDNDFKSLITKIKNQITEINITIKAMITKIMRSTALNKQEIKDILMNLISELQDIRRIFKNIIKEFEGTLQGVEYIDHILALRSNIKSQIQNAKELVKFVSGTFKDAIREVDDVKMAEVATTP